jgi:hypothetical protein
MSYITKLQGVSFRPAEVKETLKLIGDEDSAEFIEVILEPEPSNQYDPNAVKILFDGTFMGYVEKKIAADIAAAISEGAAYTASISGWASHIVPFISIVFDDE